MTDQAIGLTHSASVPRGSIVGIARTERGVVPIQYGIIAGDLVAESFGLFVVVGVALTIVFAKSPSRVAGSTILDHVERGDVNLGGMLIRFLGQLARLGSDGSMLSVHTGGEIPRVLGVEGVADDDFPGSIRATLLEVVTVRYLIVVMTGATGLLRTVRHFAIGGERASIETLQNDLVMQRDLGGH